LPSVDKHVKATTSFSTFTGRVSLIEIVGWPGGTEKNKTNKHDKYKLIWRQKIIIIINSCFGVKETERKFCNYSENTLDCTNLHNFFTIYVPPVNNVNGSTNTKFHYYTCIINHIVDYWYA
jgi:hypothetical protein